MKRLSLIFVAFFAVVCVWAGNDYVIYPVPHFISQGAGQALVTKTVYIVPSAAIDNITVDRAKTILEALGYKTEEAQKIKKGSTNLLLGIYGSDDLADKETARLGIKQTGQYKQFFTEGGSRNTGRYVFNLSGSRKGTAQMVIAGENTDAVFYGLATMKQVLTQDFNSSFIPVTVVDGADIRDRGVIEGYYGVPYSADVTKDLFRFMADYKMNTYMYGAKSDPYHSRYWADPYPTEITEEQRNIGYLTQDMMRDLTSVARANKIDFIWAIHPGTAFTDPENKGVLDQIMHKFEAMHALGVRQFGVFVDDVGVPSDDALLRLGADRLTELQRRIDAMWNGPGANPADTVKPLHYVPQLYAFSWVNIEQGKRFFSSLRNVPAKVRIYITGRAVWSVPNSEDIRIVGEWLGREPSWWWNYPCNDNDVTKLFIADTYTNFRDEKHVDSQARFEPFSISNLPTLISNPMQQGAASKIALFSIADYSWNSSSQSFDNQKSWRAAVKAMFNQRTAEQAFCQLVPFLRYFDSDALAYHVRNYKRSVAEGRPDPVALCREMQAVIWRCQTIRPAMESREEAKYVYDDIRPWLLKLEAMASEVKARLEGKPTQTVDLDNNPEFQFPILTGMGADISLSMKTAEPAAEVLQPFLLWLREQSAGK
ncbi:MAG: beta-N-acetylglucosaminidase domain-containing protein [Bacteroidaceae bacterium]|nr:beta-N-acetylglucosaminidase domain-containing protein [Bacteroidaceae bacterium]